MGDYCFSSFGLYWHNHFKGFCIVPQGYKWIVQRLGKYHTTLSPGLNFVIPYVDEVAYKITTKDIVLDIPSQEVITRDNAVLVMNAGCLYQPHPPEKAVYGIEKLYMGNSKPCSNFTTTFYCG